MYRIKRDPILTKLKKQTILESNEEIRLVIIVSKITSK